MRSALSGETAAHSRARKLDPVSPALASRETSFPGGVVQPANRQVQFIG